MQGWVTLSRALFRLSFAKPKPIKTKVGLTKNQSEHTNTCKCPQARENSSNEVVIGRDGGENILDH